MSSTTDRPTWLVAVSGAGRVRHMRDETDDRLWPICRSRGAGWRAATSADALPECSACNREAIRDVIREANMAIEAARDRTEIGGRIRDVAEKVRRWGITHHILCGTRWRQLYFDSGEREAAYQDAVAQVVAWLHEAADVLDPDRVGAS